jgi:hypothetical protein
MKFRIVRPWPVAGIVISNGTLVDVASVEYAHLKGKIPPKDAVCLDDECFRAMSHAYGKGVKIAYDQTYEVEDKVKAYAKAKLR